MRVGMLSARSLLHENKISKKPPIRKAVGERLSPEINGESFSGVDDAGWNESGPIHRE
jgi:hypothetical protein